MKRHILTLLATLLTAIAATAATFTVDPPSGVIEGDKFAVVYRLVGGSDAVKINAPQISGCTMIHGPAVSQSHSYSYINGRQSSSDRIEYTYIYRAGAPGNYTIPAASVTADGRQLTTRPVRFSILARGSRPDRGQPAGPASFDDPDTQTADKPVSSNDVFIRIILNKSHAYEQEAIDCTIKLYTVYNISTFLATKQPSFDGFLIQEQNFQQATGRMESYNGREYMTAVLKKCIIFPQKSGKLTINSGNYELEVVQFDHVNMGMFTVRDPKRRKIQVTSNSASINIDPLPTPKPAGFSGAVGTFRVDTRLVGNTFRTNEPSTLIYTIAGTGNIKYLTEPAINFPPEFEQYSPNSDIKADVAGNSVSGTMTIDYTFVPQSVGHFTIPGSTFIYFDPTTARYVTLTTPARSINVTKGSAAPAGDRKAQRRKNTDILPIHHVSGTAGSPVILSPFYWAAYIIIIAGLATLLFIYRRNIKRAADIIGSRRARAGKVARRRLARADRFLKANDSDHFYEEMLRAMWGYLSDKLVIPVSQLSRDNISEQLTRWGADTPLIDRVITILDDCEMARYTPDAPARMSDVRQSAAIVIDTMENPRQPHIDITTTSNPS